jgi:hypothetical protein
MKYLKNRSIVMSITDSIFYQYNINHEENLDYG